MDLGKYVDSMGAPRMKWIAIGSSIFKIGRRYELLNDDGRPVGVREVSKATWEDVQHVEIWGLDCLDIAVDPVAPFSP